MKGIAWISFLHRRRNANVFSVHLPHIRKHRDEAAVDGHGWVVVVLSLVGVHVPVVLVGANPRPIYLPQLFGKQVCNLVAGCS